MKTVSDLMLSDYAYAHGMASYIAQDGFDVETSRLKLKASLHPKYSPCAIDKLSRMHDVIHSLVSPESTCNDADIASSNAMGVAV